MKDSSNGSSKLIALLVLLAVLAAGAYVFLGGKSDDATDTNPAPVAVEQMTPAAPTATTETPSDPNDASDLVVETKTLNLPAAAAPTIPSSEKSSDPAVEAMMGVRKIGSDSAPIKVVEYSSLTCGHCASFHKDDLPKIKEQYIDTGKVQFIFKEFPLNKPAVDASKILRCMPEDKFVAFQNLLFTEQEKWAYQSDYLTPLKQNAKLAGLSDDSITKCLDNKDLENRIIGDMKAGTEKYKIQSTPTFILNDGVKTIVGHQQLSVFEDHFKALLDEAGQNTSANPIASETAPVGSGTTTTDPVAPSTAPVTPAPATTEPAPAAASPTADATQATAPATPDAAAAESTGDQPQE